MSQFIPFSCTLASCNGLAIWDFTTEAQALASAGGGELPLSLGPIPPFVRTQGFNTLTQAFYAFEAAVNYPRSHGGPVAGAFTMTFAEACPRTLTVAVDPSVVRPSLPANTVLTGTLANRLPQAMVTATVKACPAQGGGVPASVPVTFQVSPPTTPDGSGGHVHSANRRTGLAANGHDDCRADPPLTSAPRAWPSARTSGASPAPRARRRA